MALTDDTHMSRPWEPYAHGEKVSKETAEYQKGTPFDRCGLCTYKEGSKCKVVTGFIVPYMKCKYYSAKD